MAILAADTDKITSEKLREAQRIVQLLRQAFDESVEADMPPGVVRSDDDKDIYKFLKSQLEIVNNLVVATEKLCGSDIPPTDDIRKSFELVEELNSGGGPNNHKH
jgi:hypothetical protein